MKMLVTIDISKGFAAWKQMAKDMAPEMEKVGVCKLLAKEKMLLRPVPKEVKMLQALQ